VSKTRGNEPTKRGKKREAPKPTATTPTKDRNLPFTRWDTNKDGFLSLDEYNAGQKGGENLEARFKKFDKNGDTKLTSEEFVGSGAK
jgi:Ca2+-binding EF-hand superfamily protein